MNLDDKENKGHQPISEVSEVEELRPWSPNQAEGDLRVSMEQRQQLFFPSSCRRITFSPPSSHGEWPVESSGHWKEDRSDGCHLQD